MLRFPLITLLAFMLILPSANAVEINNEGEARLRALLTTFIDDQKAVSKSSETTLEVDGEIIIEQAKTYYAATLPKLTHISSGGNKMELSLISINAVPTDNPDDWKMSITLPKSIPITNKEGIKKQKISFGSQKMQGLWSHDLNSFSKFNAEYDDIIVTHNDKPDRTIINNFKVIGNLKKAKNGKWSGPSKAIISEFKIETGKQEYVSIEEIGSNFQLINYDPENRKKLLEAIDVANKEGRAIELSQVMKVYGPDYDLDMTIENIKANAPERINKKGIKKEAMNASIDQIFLRLSSASDKNQAVDYTFKMGYRDLKASNLEELTPTNFNIDLVLGNIPVKEIKEMVTKSGISADNPNSAKIAALQGMMLLPQILSNAKTTFKLKNTGFDNDNYKVVANGDFKATKDSPIGVLGGLKLELDGLDKVVKDLEKRKEGADPATVSKINSTLKNIQAVQLFSEKKGDSDILNLKIGEDGKILINEKDISLLMGRKPVEPITIESATQKDN